MGECFVNPGSTAEVSYSNYIITFNNNIENDRQAFGMFVFFLPAMASLGQQALFFSHISGSQSEMSCKSLQQSIILTITLFFVTWENTPVFSNALSAENQEPFLCNKELSLTGKYTLPYGGRKLMTLNLIKAIIFTSSNKTSHLRFPSLLYRCKYVGKTKL